MASNTSGGGGRGGGKGVLTAVASILALIFSAYNLYDNSLHHPDLRSFVPPVIFYASANPNSNYEVFEVPVTTVNHGARSGTLLSMDLEVTNPRSKEVKHFYAGGFGHFPGVNEPFPNFRPFAPISEAGKASSSESVLFYARFEEPVKQIVDGKGLYQFVLTAQPAVPDDLGVIDRFFHVAPTPIRFEMEAPDKDFRVFDRGSEVLHAPGWQIAPAADAGKGN